MMNRGVNRNTVFFDDAARLEFGTQLRSIHERFGVAVLAYCLMGNHYHLLLRTEPGTISPAMQHLASRFTRNTNERLGRDGPLFRGRFHAIPVTTDEYLLAASRYIHRNPLDIARLRSIEQYRWSSYRAYLQLRRPAPFLDTTVLGEMVGGPEAMREFHRSPGLADLVHGGDDPVRTLTHIIDLAIGVVALDLDDQPLTARLDQTVIHLLDEVPGIDRYLVAELRGSDRSANALALAKRRAHQRRAHDPIVDRVLSFIADNLAPSDDVRHQPTSRRTFHQGWSVDV